jgi:hypothetical protein
MTSLMVMVAGCLLCLSIFQFSLIYGQINESFNAITPAVIQQSLQFVITKDQWVIYMDPQTTSAHISNFFPTQLTIPFEDYQFHFTYFQTDQVTVCFSRCQGVEIILTSIIYQQVLNRKVHYQLYAT